jgi:hypothetical protein
MTRQHTWTNPDGLTIGAGRNTSAPEAPATEFTDAQVAALANAANAQTLTLTSIAKAMLGLGAPQLQPIPARVTPYAITGTTIYCDPSYGGTQSGTFAQPWSSAANINTAVAALTAGQGLLFKAGTTFVMTASFAPVTGTSVAPIVIGAYDPVSGGRITGVQGAAFLNANNAVDYPINLTNKSFVCVDGLEMTGKAVTSDVGAIHIDGTAASCQVLNCFLRNLPHSGITANNNLSHVFEGNLITDVQKDGIVTYAATGAASCIFQFNTIRNFGLGGSGTRGGIRYTHFGTAGSTTGRIACNFVERGFVNTPLTIGVIAQCTGGSPLIFRNTIRTCMAGATIDGVFGTIGNMTGALIENNDISNCEFGIYQIYSSGAWLHQYNRVSGSGSFDGINPCRPAVKYGRGFEIWGNDATNNCSGGTIRFNTVTGSYSFLANGSEGVGIGLDNQSMNITVYGNYCANNEGNGIQVFDGNNNSVFGNVLVNNAAAPDFRGLSWSENLRSDLNIGYSRFARVFNNTVVSLPTTRFGIADNNDNSPGARIFNNLIVGPLAVAGVARSLTAGYSTESNNVIIGAPTLVTNLTGTPTTAGTGTVAGTRAAFRDGTAFFQPVAGGLCDGTGAEPLGFGVSFDGQQLAGGSGRTPIGALFPAVLT